MQINHKQNIIELHNLSFSYQNEEVIKDISLSVHKGDYLGIVGPNGGGKSTLLKLILGLLTPTRGEVLLFGQALEKFKDWSKFGYISQQVAHIDPTFPMSVEEIVTMGRYAKLGLFHFPMKKDREAVQKALEQVGMWDFRKRLIGDLSGGQQQRVFIARALAGEPEVIVLDEPTVGVDEKTQKQFYTLLQSLNNKLNLTLLLVSHELDIVSHEATEIAYINRDLVYYGFPKAFLDSEYVEKLTGKGVHKDA
ncbi:MAG TPA: metal ABC transporter ATP-binding protein [Candidatus Sulfotelmatobacter sp.]|nr:metal ABC transporter ATP-binding protein [Candidatus Sulfotelmatobacter sp.]